MSVRTYKNLKMNSHVSNKNLTGLRMKLWRPRSKLRSSMMKKKRPRMMPKKPNNYSKMRGKESKSSNSMLMS